MQVILRASRADSDRVNDQHARREERYPQSTREAVPHSPSYFPALLLSSSNLITLSVMSMRGLAQTAS